MMEIVNQLKGEDCLIFGPIALIILLDFLGVSRQDCVGEIIVSTVDYKAV